MAFGPRKTTFWTPDLPPPGKPPQVRNLHGIVATDGSQSPCQIRQNGVSPGSLRIPVRRMPARRHGRRRGARMGKQKIPFCRSSRIDDIDADNAWRGIFRRVRCSRFAPTSVNVTSRAPRPRSTFSFRLLISLTYSLGGIVFNSIMMSRSLGCVPISDGLLHLIQAIQAGKLPTPPDPSAY